MVLFGGVKPAAFEVFMHFSNKLIGQELFESSSSRLTGSSAELWKDCDFLYRALNFGTHATYRSERYEAMEPRTKINIFKIAAKKDFG